MTIIQKGERMSDFISRRAAIDEVKRIHDVAWANWKETRISANTMIDALKDLPTAQPTQTNTPNALGTLDCISRKAAINAMCDNCDHVQAVCPHYPCKSYNAVERLPAAQPERMRGRWQDITASDCSGYDPVLAGYDDPVVGYVCSTCHEGYEKEVMGKVTWNYCPNCGSYNGGEVK